jgi:hypothetical protein
MNSAVAAEIIGKYKDNILGASLDAFAALGAILQERGFGQRERRPGLAISINPQLCRHSIARHFCGAAKHKANKFSAVHILRWS